MKKVMDQSVMLEFSLYKLVSLNITLKEDSKEIKWKNIHLNMPYFTKITGLHIHQYFKLLTKFFLSRLLPSKMKPHFDLFCGHSHFSG